ncbi:Succinyl-diaminopimelate desuccinylase [invertebrate metagenome]|uniref:Succinyl-diaminopimelate desuccinylase n=1 Tax=invertebrate metagenome TaxID=1711999 RepID=A0A2H9TAI5_9ZZZZ
MCNSCSVLNLARQLIGCPSITPDDAGCQPLIIEQLVPLGFEPHFFQWEGVSNIWLKKGKTAPLLVFAGHTDVVTPGDRTQWQFPPFEAVVKDGVLYGRGASDMKGSLAAMICAVIKFVKTYPEHSGSIAFLLTSDEEGSGENGTRRLLQELCKKEEIIDWCIVGEPSSKKQVGDVIKNGRRGSLHGHLIVKGIPGHIAYPCRARNPIHQLLPVLTVLTRMQWDKGNAFFSPTSFQVWDVQGGLGAENMIPDVCHVRFNFRFSSEVTVEQLQEKVKEVLDHYELDYDVSWRVSGLPFLTKPGHLIHAVQAAIRAETGNTACLSTSGGTSDGRFIASDVTEVVELGPVNKTIHRVNECVQVNELFCLERIFYGCLKRLLLE